MPKIEIILILVILQRISFMHEQGYMSASKQVASHHSVASSKQSLWTNLLTEPKHPVCVVQGRSDQFKRSSNT